MIHYFNPGHETAVLNLSKYYMAPANVILMQHELAYLPAWYAAPDDYVLVERELPEDFISFLHKNVKMLAVGVSKDKLLLGDDTLKRQPVRFWGLSPQALHLFETMNEEYGTEFVLPEWNNKYRNLISRETARDCLKFIIDNSSLFSSQILPEFYTSLEEVEETVGDNPEVQYLAKSPYSSSGRGLLWLPYGQLTRTEKQILNGHFNKQGKISLERALNKKVDFALEFSSLTGQIKYIGLSVFETNTKGAYSGNFLGSQEYLSGKIGEYISLSLIEEVKEIITRFLEKNILSSYKGYIGVDMMIYEEKGEYLLQPCVEINLRNNMGIVAYSISTNYIAENSTGSFHIDFNSQAGVMYDRHNEMQKLYPPAFRNGRIKSGYLSLCPVGNDNRYRAYILVNG